MFCLSEYMDYVDAMDSPRHLSFEQTIMDDAIYIDGNVVAEKSIFNDSIRSEETNVYMEEADGEIDKEFAENENAIVDPYVGLEFESKEETYKCYNDYAKIIGFSIRRQHMKHSKLNNDVIGRTYVCFKEGKKRAAKGVENPRPNTRIDCKAMMKVKRITNGKWILLDIVKEHNHEVELDSSRFFRSQKKINTPEKNQKVQDGYQVEGMMPIVMLDTIPYPRVLEVDHLRESKLGW
ncbi:hypothetical protein IFM89_031847, partial [Coptis chinensis]